MLHPDAICVIDGCGAPKYAGAFCRVHFKAWRAKEPGASEQERAAFEKEWIAISPSVLAQIDAAIARREALPRLEDKPPRRKRR